MKFINKYREKINIFISNIRNEYQKRKKERERIKQEKRRIEEERRQREEEVFREKIYSEHLKYTNPGEYGEYLITKILNNDYIPGYKKILQNLYIPYNGRTSEIDVLLIHEKGIFIFESKNFSGWIFGTAGEKNWTQSLNKYTKTKFYNPIRQNSTHINALSQYLKIDKRLMKSIIVFSDECTLMKIPQNTEYYTITQVYYLTNVLTQELYYRNDIFTIFDIDNIAIELEPLTNVSEEIKQYHINNINRNFKY